MQSCVMHRPVHELQVVTVLCLLGKTHVLCTICIKHAVVYTHSSYGSHEPSCMRGVYKYTTFLICLCRLLTMP